jgi:hypothetical protein
MRLWDGELRSTGTIACPRMKAYCDHTRFEEEEELMQVLGNNTA